MPEASQISVVGWVTVVCLVYIFFAVTGFLSAWMSAGKRGRHIQMTAPDRIGHLAPSLFTLDTVTGKVTTTPVLKTYVPRSEG